MSDPKRVVKLAKQFREVLEVAEDLAKIGDLEQARRNAEDQLNNAVKDYTIASRSLSDVKALLVQGEDDLKVVKKEAEDIIFLAKQVGGEIVAVAKEEAKAIVKKALALEKVVADRIVVDQERHRVEMEVYAQDHARAQAAVVEIEEKLADLREQIGLS